MSTESAPAGGGGSERWRAFHLFVRGADRVLAPALLPWAEAESAAGRLRRFFFIRFSEGGPHLRVRVVARRSGDAEALGDALDRRVRDVLGDDPGGYRLERRAYDRGEHYFGETRASVYAELLNEATSWVALRLLRATGPERGAARWVAAAAALHHLLRHGAPGEEGFRRALDDSHAFARDAAASLGHAVPEDGGRTMPAASVAAALPRVDAALAADAAAVRAARLLRRARGEGERFAATHALHLLCNKLGYSLREELEMVALLRALPPPAPDGA